MTISEDVPTTTFKVTAVPPKPKPWFDFKYIGGLLCLLCVVGMIIALVSVSGQRDFLQTQLSDSNAELRCRSAAAASVDDGTAEVLTSIGDQLVQFNLGIVAIAQNDKAGLAAAVKQAAALTQEYNIAKKNYAKDLLDRQNSIRTCAQRQAAAAAAALASSQGG